MKLSIIIPVYNEERTLKEIIYRVKKARIPAGVSSEIIVVDDASEDSSKLRFQSAKLEFKIKNLKLVEHKKNKGKGAAVRSGIKTSSGDIILIQDADLEYNPADYSRLLKPILEGKTRIVYGTRLKNYPLKLFGNDKTPLPLHLIGNKFLTFVTNLLYGSNLSDMETGYKVFKAEVLKGVKLKSKRFEFEPEITAKVLKRGYNIYEVPIKVNPRGYDEGKKITWRDGFSATWTLIKYRFTD
ncbi:glycosyltransferase family 2 protein [Patescibacteria group bacterium]|nr:glycosyltransferase family 2 protein [Patescibacteria group bacterium]